MDQFRFNLIEYFGRRMSNIIKFHDLIESVNVDTRRYEPYKRSYYVVYINVLANKSYKRKTVEKPGMGKTLEPFPWDNESDLSCTYIVESSNRKDKNYSHDDYFKRLKEFSESYYMLCSLFTSVLSKRAPAIQLQVHSLEKHPEINYSQRIWNDVRITEKSYFSFYKTTIEEDINQFFSLYRTSKRPEEFIGKDTVSDGKLSEQTGVSVNKIRDMVIAEKLPFMIEGGRTINSIHIDVSHLKHSITKNGIRSIDRESASKIANLYANKLPKIRKSKKKKAFFLQENDIILLKNTTIGRVVAINWERDEIICVYKVINRKCIESSREEFCNPVKEVEKRLSADNHKKIKDKFSYRPYEQLESYMKRLKSMDWSRIKK